MQDLTDIYYFVQVVELGSFTAASKALGVAKSQLSFRVARLEASPGVRLSRRGSSRPPLPANRNLRPTEPIASYTSTAMPAVRATSAAIRPAGPPPMTASRGVAGVDIRPWSHGHAPERSPHTESWRDDDSLNCS
ncbi:hypothetical protein RLIN73S_06686 [Rhodanobacter lindaniclasticus]